jgi:hypothetical protein
MKQDPANEADPRCHGCNGQQAGPVISLVANRGSGRWPAELEFCSFACLKTWTNDPRPTQTGWDTLGRHS